MSNQAEKISKFYDEYGERELRRLDQSPYDRLNFLLHMDFIKDLARHEVEWIDVGCGGGKYSAQFAKEGANVSLFDISKEQLVIAKRHMEKEHVQNKLKKTICGNLSEMTAIEDEAFNVTICYGAPLNYLYDHYEMGISELYRITKKGGTVAVSVNSRMGVIRGLLGREGFDKKAFFGQPEYWFIDQVIQSGNLPEHPEVAHPARHFFTGEEMKTLFEEAGFEAIELASSPCIGCGLTSGIDEISDNQVALDTILRIEKHQYKNPGLVDSGEFILIRGRKPEQ